MEPLFKRFFVKYAYPVDGAEALLKELDRILAHHQLGPALLDAVWQYESGSVSDTAQLSALLKQVQEAAPQCGFREEPVSLLLFLLMTRHLETLYRHAGLSSAWFDGVARDLRSKLNECHAVYSSLWTNSPCSVPMKTQTVRIFGVSFIPMPFGIWLPCPGTLPCKERIFNGWKRASR